MANIVMIVASKNFQDEEYLIPRGVLEKHDHKIKVASNKDKLIGSFGHVVLADLKLEDVNVGDFDGILFVGGVGARSYFTNEDALELARKFKKKEKYVFAICIAPVILALAGILKGREATVWEDQRAIQLLKQMGAKYVKQDVVVSDSIITASGPFAATEFGLKICELLS